MAGSTDAVASVMAELETFIAQEVGALGLEVRAELVKDTRVDTGWARGNHQMVSGHPARSTVGGGGSFSEAAALRVALSYRLDDGPLYVSNRVAYVGLRGVRRGALTVSEAEAVIRRAIDNRLGVEVP